MNSAWRQRALLFLAISVFAFSILFLTREQRESTRPIPPTGGESFANFPAIETPFFRQQDPRWRDETVGGSGEKLADVGCTVCCLAMALHPFGIETTPGELNDYLKVNGGYNFRGWLKWSAVERFTRGKVTVDHARPLSHRTMDGALSQGRLVLAKVVINQSTQHWVLIVGKEGTEYLVHDPLGDGKTLDKLSSYGSQVFSIRVVKAL